MKNLFIYFLLVIAGLSFTSSTFDEVPKKYTYTSSYAAGWKDGYCEGWKDVKGQFAICPPAPVAPVALVSCYSGYKCGYNRGFKAGREKALSKSKK